jgi:hypothetical protein
VQRQKRDRHTYIQANRETDIEKNAMIMTLVTHVGTENLNSYEKQRDNHIWK